MIRDKMKSRVFWELESLRNRGFPNFGDTACAEPIDNMGEKIEDEFKKRPLQEEEEEVALDYFSENYVRSLRASERYINAAGKAVPYSLGVKVLMNKARHFLERAAKAEVRAQKICKCSIADVFDVSEDEVMDDIKDLENELKVMDKFPVTFSDILRFERGKREAVEREEYMLAGFFQKQIDRISDMDVDYQKDLALEYTGDAD
jgi:hypothetical protein